MWCDSQFDDGFILDSGKDIGTKDMARDGANSIISPFFDLGARKVGSFTPFYYYIYKIDGRMGDGYGIDQ
jgi:hypothetical protein